MQKTVGLVPCQYRWTKALDLSRDEPTIRHEIEKDGHIGVVFAKHPPMPVQCTDGLGLDGTTMLELGVIERLKINEIILGLLYLKWDGMKGYVEVYIKE